MIRLGELATPGPWTDHISEVHRGGGSPLQLHGSINSPEGWIVDNDWALNAKTPRQREELRETFSKPTEPTFLPVHGPATGGTNTERKQP